MSSFKAKVLLIGTKAVDKTSLIMKIVKSRFHSNHKLITGVNILSKDVEFRKGEIATLSIWDIGGQQRFEFIRSKFYKGAAGAILVFDLTREQNFIEIKKFITEITQFAGENIPFALVGYNVHLLELRDKSIIRKEACEFAKNEGGIYIEITPNKVELLEKAICELTRRIINSRI